MFADPWENLRRLTSARIALGRSGGSLPTRELLAFELAHARARDAVLSQFNADRLADEIRSLGVDVRLVSSAARSREAYLARPDLGRQLEASHRESLSPPGGRPCDLAIVVSDGLSPLAAERQSVRLLSCLLPRLLHDDWQIAPVVVVRYGRVAIEDEIGAALGASLALILLGERPGLGSPDSLGAYLVYAPRVGRTDAERNCVSNIRPEGLTPEAAAETLHYLLTEARQKRLSGVALKDERRLAAGNTPQQRL